MTRQKNVVVVVVVVMAAGRLPRTTQRRINKKDAPKRTKVGHKIRFAYWYLTRGKSGGGGREKQTEEWSMAWLYEEQKY